MARSWRIDTEANITPSTPIITVLPSVEIPEKIIIHSDDRATEKKGHDCQVQGQTTARNSFVSTSNKRNFYH